MEDAREWAESAMRKRPWRAQFFEQFVAELRGINHSPLRILELGSGPGFLAHHILQAIPVVEYTMLDFSPAMHELAHERLGTLIQHVRPVSANLKSADWHVGLGRYDAVVTIQAVHELRHKKHALALHEIVRSLLGVHGRYLVCDHYVGSDGMTNNALFMTAQEQHDCLAAAGFGDVKNVLQTHGMVLHRATVNPG